MLDHKKVAQAQAFATKKHRGQVRPGGEPQMDHVNRVAERAARFVFSLPEKLAIDCICAAYLHDVVEDTPVTRIQIARMFGERVAKIVQAVSHEEEEEPDEVYLARVATGGHLAVIVKRADRLDNLDTLRNAPREFCQRKLAEIRRALPIWYQIDPVGAPLIDALVKEIDGG